MLRIDAVKCVKSGRQSEQNDRRNSVNEKWPDRGIFRVAVKNAGQQFVDGEIGGVAFSERDIKAQNEAD